MTGLDGPFRELVRLTRTGLHNVVYRITGNPSDALDAAQETFGDPVPQDSRVPFREQVLEWVYRIAVNASIDLKRRSRARSLTSLDALQEGRGPLASAQGRFDPTDEKVEMPIHAALRHELEREVQRAISNLSPKLRAITVLRYIESQSYEQIAETLQISLGPKLRLARAHDMLAPVPHARDRPVLPRMKPEPPDMKPELPLSCHEFRILALERVELARGEGAAPVASAAGHACAECERWVTRLALREGLVRSLPRHLPPRRNSDSALAGALEANARQDRGRRVAQPRARQPGCRARPRGRGAGARGGAAGAGSDDLALRQRAPSVLDRLVAEELADPAKAHVVRQIENLERQRAPAVDLRVRYASRPQPRLTVASRRVVAAWTLAAAALLAVTVSPLMFRDAGDGPRAPRRFRVEVVESTRDLSPAARAWIETASSGMLGQHNI